MSEPHAESRFLELELPVEVWLASEQVPLERLLSLEPGDMLPLDHDPDGPVSLVVNGSTVATGELVVVDGHFGFRVGTPSKPGIDEVESRAAAEAGVGADDVGAVLDDDGAHDGNAGDGVATDGEGGSER